MERYFSFRNLISVGMIKVLYVLGMIGIILGAIVVIAPLSQFVDIGVPGLLLLVLVVIIIQLLWRLVCEQWIVLFRIHESLEHLELMAQDWSARESWQPASGSPQPGPAPASTISAGGPVPALLRVISGPDAGRTFTLNRDNITIGRDAQNDVVLADPMVSGLHCRLRYGQGAWYIQDAGSTNGTIVNGERITARRLVQGDRLELGDSTLMFELIT